MVGFENAKKTDICGESLPYLCNLSFYRIVFCDITGFSSGGLKALALIERVIAGGHAYPNWRVQG